MIEVIDYYKGLPVWRVTIDLGELEMVYLICNKKILKVSSQEKKKVDETINQSYLSGLIG